MRRFAASYVYTLDGVPLRDGFVEMEDDGTVIRTGLCEDPASEENFYDGAMVPGFVNSHCHVELSHLKGRFRKGSGMAGFIDQINELRDAVPSEEKIEILKGEMESLWVQGVAAMADISNCEDSFAVKAASPIYTRTFIEVFGTEPEDCGAVMASARSLKEKADSYGIDASVTPHACYTMSPELVTAAAAEGLATGYISYHSQESDQEEDMIRYGSGAMWDNRKAAGMSTPPVTGTSSLEYFIERLWTVHPAPFEENILLVHNVYLDEVAARAALGVMKNVYWAVCPLSNVFINNQLPPIDLMRSLGLKITVGTDSLSSNDSLDMVKELYCIQSAFPHVTMNELFT